VSGLMELQHNFQNYLRHHDALIENAIISSEKVAAVVRLDIYRDAYYLRLLEALTADFPVLHVLMGDEHFDKMGRAYIDAYPSQFRSVRWYGNVMAEYLQGAATYSQYPALSEMAKFEWLMTEAFDAEDVDVVTLEDMAATPFEKWPEMRFKIHPALRRSSFEWNVLALWKAVQAEEIPTPERAEEKIDWMFWRKNLDVQFCSLSVDEAYVIDAMHAGQSFEEICEGLCEWLEPEQVAMHAASLLKRFVIDELIVQVML
jgi:hypothetical protein